MQGAKTNFWLDMSYTVKFKRQTVSNLVNISETYFYLFHHF